MASGHLPTPFGIILTRRQIGHCELCEEHQGEPVPFYTDRDVRTHMVTLAHRESVLAEMGAEAERRKRLALIYDPENESTDVEVEEHLRKVGKRMLAEGRWVVKPNEKAGF
jgi:hypothetical protein